MCLLQEPWTIVLILKQKNFQWNYINNLYYAKIKEVFIDKLKLFLSSGPSIKIQFSGGFLEAKNQATTTQLIR